MLPVLEHVMSDELSILGQNLDTEETLALVEAMESRVEKVGLYEVTLDIEALAGYDGQGKCRALSCYDETADNNRDQLLNLATSINWEETIDTLSGVYNIRIQKPRTIFSS